MITETISNDLFPSPSSPPSNLIPNIWPGITSDSTIALREVLSDNHHRWHIFFNDRGFHNHTAHHALAIWALGAPGEVIRAGYQRDSGYQRPLTDSPGSISVDNFKEHVSDSQYYAAYIAFFTDYIRKHGISSAVDKFIFSKEFNDDEGGHHPDMLGRFLGGLLHPMIHLGYGFEFCLPGIVVEGLAQTAIHRDSTSACIPSSLFEVQEPIRSMSNVISRMRSLVTTDTPQPSIPSVHVFTILARVLNDPELANIHDSDNKGLFTTTVTEHGAALAEHIKDWRFDPSDQHDVERKIEELSWMNSLIYAVGGSQLGKPFNADFFHMHLVTSSLFLPAYVANLSPASKSLLLRGYLFTSLGWWVSRGRPGLDIKKFYETTTEYPTLPSHLLPIPNKDALLSNDPKASVPNPWLPLMENALVHPDEHFSKIQRALVHYGSVYGHREAGRPDFKNTELKGSEILDGTLFIRAAALTDKKLGRVRLGEDPGKWDMDGF